MFSLTCQERRVILFLISAALVGSGVNFLVKINASLKALACFSPDIGKVNLNTADEQILKTIPGIGEKLAQRIIDYRINQGGFGDLEELKNIKGITNYRYEKFKDSLTLQ